ncbi:MAG: hypothetical protein PWQ93_77 [Clostridiales bacterium]|nr:hypothetical protein [Clostridiales bacterium]
MFVSAIWHYIFGYVIIKVEGMSLEKFINLCLQRGIHLWDVKRQSYSILKARISIRGLKQLISISYITHCRIEILSKRGLPFLFSRLKHRYMFIAGFILFFVIIYILSSFIWTVEINGNARISGQRILDELADSGLKPGIRREDLSINDIENDMLIKMPELSWIGIELKGTKAIVRIVEAVMPPERIDIDQPCDVVASKDGVISKITVMQGQAVVKVGQTVKKSQLLITGVIEKEGVDTRYVHAMGEVLARRWYEGHAEAPTVSVRKRRTGNMMSKRCIIIGERKINISDPDITYSSYDKIEVVNISLDKIGIPAKMITEEYYETIEETTTQDIETVQKKVQQLAIEDAKKNLPQEVEEIADETVTFSMDDDGTIHADALLEVIERIDQEQAIQIPIEEESNSGNTAERR